MLQFVGHFWEINKRYLKRCRMHDESDHLRCRRFNKHFTAVVHSLLSLTESWSKIATWLFYLLFCQSPYKTALCQFDPARAETFLLSLGPSRNKFNLFLQIFVLCTHSGQTLFFLNLIKETLYWFHLRKFKCLKSRFFRDVAEGCGQGRSPVAVWVTLTLKKPLTEDFLSTVVKRMLKVVLC